MRLLNNFFVKLLIFRCLASFTYAATYNVCGIHICDEAGNTVIFRGFNIAADGKVPDFRPLKGDLIEKLSSLVDMGANVVRFPFFWEAYEQKRGSYDEAYLVDYYENVINVLQSLGIQTIVDFHQDGFSRYSLKGCGSGFPEWALPSWYKPFKPVNSAEGCKDWGTNLVFSVPVRRVFNSFYENDGNVRSEFLKMANRVISKLCKHDGVLGFDLLNEPLGNERQQLSPLYNELISSMRTIKCQKIAFLAPSALSSSGLPNFTLVRPENDTNIVFAPHFYNPIAHIGIGRDFGLFSRIAFDKMKKLSHDEWKSPFFVTEFGTSASSKNPTYYLDAMYEKLDHYLASGTQWTFTPGWTSELKDGWNGEDFSVIDASNNKRIGYRPRPYAQIIAGTPISMSFDPTNQYFYLEWINNQANQETIIFIPDPIQFGIVGHEWVPCASSGVTCSPVSKTKLSCRSSSLDRAYVQLILGKPGTNCQHLTLIST
jgi:endoglycosylceramidase